MCRRIAVSVMLAGISLLLTACPAPPPPEGDSLNIRLNGVDKAAPVPFIKEQGQMLFDVEKFMQAIGGRFVPIILNGGIATQYGKRIGFGLNGFEFAMVQTKLCEMAPKLRAFQGAFYAPTLYFERMTDGALTLDMEHKRLSIDAPEPQVPGSIVPETERIASRLGKMGYTVQQGNICLTSAIDVVRGGYTANANGNNAGFPYLVIQPPLPPDAEHALFADQFIYTLREDEALVVVGRTPPECDYYSYRSYMMCFRDETEPNPFNQTKIYTQLGDPINTYNINEWQPNKNRFESFFTLVSTADANMQQAVAEAMEAEGLDKDDLLLDVVDHNLVRLGNDDYANGLHFLHRVSCVHDPDADKAYVNQPTLEVLRVTPKAPRPANLLEPFTPRTRGSGVTEKFLQPSVDALRQALLDKYAAGYNIAELTTQPWLNITGREAIDARIDVLGETRDTLYLNTDNFIFTKDTIVVVYGVNHTTVPKTVYSNVSCYGADYFNGFGGITNYDYAGTAKQFIPGDPYANKLYVWKFARTALDAETFAVPLDPNSELTGLGNGAEAFMAFRNYIDPGCLIGPDPGEIIFDRALVLTPK